MYAVTEDFGLGRESSTLVIGESKSSAAELFLQDAVLLNEVFDGLGLVAVDPAGEGRQEELEPEEVRHDIDRTCGAQGRNSSCGSAVEYSERTGWPVREARGWGWPPGPTVSPSTCVRSSCSRELSRFSAKRPQHRDRRPDRQDDSPPRADGGR